MGAQQLLLRQRSAGVNITSRPVSKFAFATSPATATATATYSLGSSGVLTLNGGTDVSGEWRLFGASADYEVRFTHTGDDVPSGVTYGVWLNLGTTRALSLTATQAVDGTTIVTGEVQVEIGRAGLNTALVSASIVLTAEAERGA